MKSTKKSLNSSPLCERFCFKKCDKIKLCKQGPFLLISGEPISSHPCALCVCVCLLDGRSVDGRREARAILPLPSAQYERACGSRSTRVISTRRGSTPDAFAQGFRVLALHQGEMFFWSFQGERLRNCHSRVQIYAALCRNRNLPGVFSGWKHSKRTRKPMKLTTT